MFAGHPELLYSEITHPEKEFPTQYHQNNLQNIILHINPLN